YGSERGNVSKVYNQTTMAGNTTILDLASLTITNYWQGFYGNISGGISLQDSQGNTFYDWNVVVLNGEVFATRAYDVNFATFNCSNSTHIGSEEAYLGHVSTTGDSVSSTFSGSTHPSFSVGSLSIPQDTCVSTNLYVNGAQGSDFYEVLLSDDASNMVYTAIIDENTVGFDGRTYDFEMLVGDKGDSSVTSYYFFMELG
ncbi:MAG: hypothetical protein NDI94_07110, partial [Candidatus Woesearchaeota archaeon]|nr:hypothetical protein [Candidatus Woesearchaeota archaeon]